jgi:hypothetical protein
MDYPLLILIILIAFGTEAAVHPCRWLIQRQKPAAPGYRISVPVDLSADQ